jgi:hypothetical protein
MAHTAVAPAAKSAATPRDVTSGRSQRIDAAGSADLIRICRCVRYTLVLGLGLWAVLIGGIWALLKVLHR